LGEKLSHIEPVIQSVNSIQADLRGITERIASVERHQFSVNQSVNSIQADLRGITERIASVERHQFSVNQSANSIQTDLRGLTERISSVEQNQFIVNQGVGNFATNTLSAITELKTITTNLSDATGSMRTELSHAKNDLTELHTDIRAKQESERQTAESIRRLETIIAGTQTKGLAGENILEVVFAKLPIEWQLRDFRIGGKSVEFALRLPNNLIMPIDSKWAATQLVEQFVNADDTQEQQRIKKAIEDTVIQKAKEVRKYIDPSITVNFGVAVIPDAVFDLCIGIQPEIFQLNVVLVSYSMFVRFDQPQFIPHFYGRINNPWFQCLHQRIN
jgi:DNA recombination protein RmuC